METLIKTIAHARHFSSAEYWHLRLLVSLTLVPLLGVLSVVFFDKRKPARTPKIQPYR